MNFRQALSDWEKINGGDKYEGPSGVRKLERLLYTMGYTPMLGNSEIISFLEDNPSALRTLVDWIIDRDDEDWKEGVMADTDFTGEFEDDEK